MNHLGIGTTESVTHILEITRNKIVQKHNVILNDCLTQQSHLSI